MNNVVKGELDYILKDYDYNNLESIDWKCISIDQNLSEDFMREFQDEVNWYYISLYQNLSDDFIIEFQDRLDLREMLKHEIIAPEFYNKLTQIPRYQLLDFS